MKILIKVTKEVLEKTSTCSSNQLNHHCAIAYAVRELFPNASVGRTAIFMLGFTGEDYEDCNKVSLSNQVINFIATFDICGPLERSRMNPLSFEIEVPEFVIQAIGVGEIYRVLSESKTLEHVNI